MTLNDRTHHLRYNFSGSHMLKWIKIDHTIVDKKAARYCCLFKGQFIATQLNSTQLDVELSWVELSSVELRRRSVYSDADATQLNWPTSRWSPVRFNWVSCIADRRRQLSCVGEGVYSDATRLDVESSCVAINGPLDITFPDLTVTCWNELRGVYSDTTQLNSTPSWVQLSWVASL